MNGEGQPRKASEWLLALAEHPGDDALRRDFDQWLAADPAHAVDWHEINHTYAILGRTVPVHRDKWAPSSSNTEAPATILPFPSPALTQRRRQPIGRRMVAGFAAAGIAASIVLTLFPVLRWQLTADHATGNAVVTAFHLGDGSTVQLGPESAIDVTMTKDERKVRLLRGSAFFEVKHDSDRPFLVETDLLQTTVLGTAFEVIANETGAAVAVRNGAVRVDGRGATEAAEKLAPGHWLRVATDGQITHGTRPPDQIAMWLQGRLIAKDMPARDVIDALMPYYSGVLIFRDDALASQPLTGIYDLKNPVGVVDAVASALHARVYQVSPWVLAITGK